MTKFNINWNAVSSGAPYITISSLSMAFNSFSASKIGNPDKVVIGLDEDKHVIAIQPYTGQVDVKPFEFGTRMKSGWIRISCKDFIKYLQAITGIDFSKSKKYVAKFDRENNFIYIELDEISSAQERSNNEMLLAGFEKNDII